MELIYIKMNVEEIVERVRETLKDCNLYNEVKFNKSNIKRQIIEEVVKMQSLQNGYAFVFPQFRKEGQVNGNIADAFALIQSFLLNMKFHKIEFKFVLNILDTVLAKNLCEVSKTLNLSHHDNFKIDWLLKNTEDIYILKYPYFRYTVDIPSHKLDSKIEKDYGVIKNIMKNKIKLNGEDSIGVDKLFDNEKVKEALKLI